MEAAAIIALVEAGLKVVELAQKEVAKAKERGEWTLEDEAAFDAKLAQAPLASYWKRND